MPEMTSNKTVYEFDSSEIRKLLAYDLNVPIHQISVEYVLKDVSEEESCYAKFEVHSVRVTVDNTK